MGLEPFMDVAELASYLGLPLSTVCDWRVRGKGPVACRFGKQLAFAVSDVRAWVTRYRDLDGRARQVQATGATARAASGR
jgi:predicted DNA-binding transcriptional regulator AlpA